MTAGSVWIGPGTSWRRDHRVGRQLLRTDRARGDGVVARVHRPIVPIVGDAAIVAERVVERTAVEPEVGRFGHAHRVEQGEARDISVVLGADQCDLRAQQLLLGVEDVEDGAGTDALFGARALERELVGLDGDGLRLNLLLSRIIVGKGGAGRRDDCALGADDLLERLAFECLGLPGARCGKPALEDRNLGVEPDRGLVAGPGNPPDEPPSSLM